MEIVKLNVNGCVRETPVEHNRTLLSALREGLGLTGTKCGCETGDCGSCKVIIDGEAVNSCQVKAVNAVGKEITTIEGLSKAGGPLHTIQQASIDCGAVRCGFCTPGMVMCTKALLDKTLNPTDEEIKEALKEDAYPIHEGGNIIMPSETVGGDPEKAIKEADHVITREYFMPAVNHCPIETHASISEFDATGKLTVWTPTQDAFGQRINLHRIFGLPMSKIRVISPVMGGGFGGKIDLVTEPVTALLAMKTGRPVKLVYGRQEEFTSARTRHAAKVKLTMGYMNDGTITGADETMILNAGAHTSATMSVCWAAGGKFFKLLNTRNLRFKGIPVYTNTQVASAMRGFGSPQQFFPVSSMINEIANILGMDPSELFLKNLADPYEKACCDGESFGNFRLKDCVIKGRELIGWDEAVKEMRES